jgi:hypothetical protein
LLKECSGFGKRSGNGIDDFLLGDRILLILRALRSENPYLHFVWPIKNGTPFDPGGTNREA